MYHAPLFAREGADIAIVYMKEEKRDAETTRQGVEAEGWKCILVAPEEIAPAYVFLASPQRSSYITGEILPIIGGYSGG
jgi:NAD(P)-dependent dehydrogenase (short-subunit alcohol dehydrogenase family)